PETDREGASPYPSAVGLAVVAWGRLPPAGSSSSVVLVDTVGLGLAGRGTKGSAHPGLRVVRGGGGRGPPRPRQIGGAGRGGPRLPSPDRRAVAECRGLASPRVARPSIREVAWP